MNYNAFMSYSHAVDGEFAPALQKSLQKLAKPWYRKRSLNIFLDETDLSISPDLWKDVENALNDSEYFILLASPEAALSKWVKKEIEFWLNHKDVEKILIVLTSGEISWDEMSGDFDWKKTTSLPGILKGKINSQPLYADMRHFQENETLSFKNTEFKDKVASLAASLHKKPKEELIGEDQRQYKRMIRFRNTTLGTILLFFILFSVSLLIAWITQNKLKKFKSNAFAYFSEIQFKTDPENSFRLAEKAYITNKSNQRAAKMLLQSYFFLMKDIKMVTDISDNSEFATFSPVENKILTINRENKLILYDTNGNELKEFEKKVHEKKVFTAFFSPDGKKVVTTSEDKTARIWNLNGDLLKELKGHNDSVEYAAFSPDGKKVVTTSKDKTARIWNLETGKSIVIEEFNQPPTTASFSNDGKIILISSDKICRFWYDSGKPFTDIKLIVNPGDTLASTIPEEYSNVDFAKYSPKGNYIIAIGLNGLKRTVRIWDKNGIQFAPPFEINYDKTSVFFSPDEKYITIADADNWIKLKDLSGNDIFSTKWDEVKRFPSQPLTDELDEVKVISASCSLNGGYIIITTDKNTVHLLALLGNKLREHEWGVNCAAFSPDGKHIITASEDGTAKLWNSKGKEIHTITGHKGAVKFASFSPDSKKIVTASADHTIRMWDLLGNEIRVFKGHVGWVNSVVFSCKGDYLLSASGDGTVRLWDAEKGNKIKVFKGSKYSWINYAEFSPDGNKIIIANEDGAARLLDLNGNEIAILKGHALGINYAAFSPCGGKIVTASDDKTIRLWDLYGNQTRKPFKVHSAGVNTVTFSPGGEYILSSSDDKTFYYWNLTGNENLNIGGHSGRTKSAFFSFDGNYIISSSTDCTIKLWGVRPESILQLANEYLRIKPLDNEQLKKYGLE